MEWLRALADWPLAAALRQSGIAYPLVNAAHILSLGLLVGSIAVLDLRLVGLWRGAPLAVLGPVLSRAAAIGLGLAAATGALLFATRPLAYAVNPAFLLKLGLVGLGVANALALRALPHWRRALAGEAPHGAVRAAAGASLALWVGAVVAGRWIGFLQ